MTVSSIARYSPWIRLSRPTRRLLSSKPSSTLPPVSSNLGIYSLLEEDERALLDEQRALVQRARHIAQLVNVTIPQENNLLDESVFTVVIAGEFNSGKSTLINALVGARLLDTGNLPTTDCITVLSHSNEVSSDQNQNHQYAPGILHYAVDLTLLRDMNLVDTPGTNALTNHTAKTMNLLPKADCILFVTSADRPFPESERKIIESIQQYRKSIILVINKMDIIETSGGDHGYKEKQQVVNFVAEHASDLLGANPTVLAVSARDALAAKLTLPHDEHDQAVIWKRSNFAALESFLRDSLTMETKIKSKLTNPIGVAEGWMNDCQKRLKKENQELEDDQITLNLLSSQLEGWRKEILTDMERTKSNISDRLKQEGKRAHVLMKRLESWPDFYNAAILEQTLLSREWKKTQRITGLFDTIEEELQSWVQETSEAMALRGRAQGQAVIEFLGQRPASRNKSLVRSVMTASKYESTRDNLRSIMGKALERHIFEDHLEQEELQLLERIKSLARTTFALNVASVASVGAGALQLLDLVGSLGLGAALTASSVIMLSNGRWKIAQLHEYKWEDRNQLLQEAFKDISKKELERMQQHVQNGVAPYTRFVQTEQERIENLNKDCQDLLFETHRLRQRINKIGATKRRS